MALGDHYRIKVSGNLNGQTALNIFYYENVITISNAEEISQWFLQSVIPAMLGVVSSDYTFTDIECMNLDDALDFWVGTFGIAGSRNSEAMGPNIAWGFTLHPNSLVQRAGSKRFAGVAEADVSDGVAQGGILSPLNTLASRLGDPIRNVTNLVIARPRIAKILYILGEPIYTWVPVNSATFKWVTTQNTRKYGRGV